MKALLFFISIMAVVACGSASKTSSATNVEDVPDNPFLGISWKIRCGDVEM